MSRCKLGDLITLTVKMWSTLTSSRNPTLLSQGSKMGGFLLSWSFKCTSAVFSNVSGLHLPLKSFHFKIQGTCVIAADWVWSSSSPGPGGLAFSAWEGIYKDEWSTAGLWGQTHLGSRPKSALLIPVTWGSRLNSLETESETRWR